MYWMKIRLRLIFQFFFDFMMLNWSKFLLNALAKSDLTFKLKIEHFRMKCLTYLIVSIHQCVQVNYVDDAQFVCVVMCYFSISCEICMLISFKFAFFTWISILVRLYNIHWLLFYISGVPLFILIETLR